MLIDSESLEHVTAESIGMSDTGYRMHEEHARACGSEIHITCPDDGSGMWVKYAEDNKSFEVQLAFLDLPSPVAESVTVLTISGVPKWVVEQKKRVMLVVEG